MRYLFVFFLIFIPFAHVDATVHEDYIVRSILTGFEWDDITGIKVNYIYIQKSETDDYPIVYEGSHMIYDQEDHNLWTFNEVIEHVQKNFYHTVYVSDEIFGQDVEIFADISQQPEITEEDLQQLIYQAVREVEQDYHNPPAIENESETLSIVEGVMFWGFPIVFLILLYLLIRHRYS